MILTFRVKGHNQGALLHFFFFKIQIMISYKAFYDYVLYAFLVVYLEIGF